MLDLEVGKTYRTANRRDVKIVDTVTDKNAIRFDAGYRFVGDNGWYYTASGDNRDSDLCLVAEVTPNSGRVEVDRLNSGRYTATVDGQMILRDVSPDELIRWLMRRFVN